MDRIQNDAADKMERALKPFALPIGLASPMWLAFGAAASMSATMWWMKTWTNLGKSAHASAPVGPPPIVTAEIAPEPPPPLALAAPAPDPVAEAEPVEAPSMEIPAPEPIEAAPIEAAPAEVPTAVEAPMIDRPDELTLLRGVGPRVADALVARGVSTFAQLAAWTDQDMAVFDADMKLLGRSKRYDFLGQARELATTE